MNQEEKIKAYLLNQLSSEETDAFRAEILKDPELMGEVKATKLLLIAKELKYREELREKMTKWGPVHKPWMQRYGLRLALGIVLLGLVGYGVKEWVSSKGPSVPATRPPIAVDSKEPLNTGVPFDDSIVSILPNPRDSFNLKNTTQKKLAKFSNAILSIEIVKKMDAIAMKGGTKIKPIDQKNKPEIGFILAYNSTYYVITNAYAIKNGGTQLGDIIGKNANGQKYYLKRVGSDEFNDIAVLSIENEKLENIQALRLSSTAINEDETVFGFNFLQKNKKDTVLLDKERIQKKNGDFLRLATNKTDNLNGPVINLDGAVVGMNSQYARSLTPDWRFSKYIIEQGRMVEVIENIIQKKGSIYTGIAFSTNDAGKVIVLSIIKDSPNEGKEYLIGKEVRSINDIKINTIADVAEVLQKIKPDKPFLLEYAIQGQGSMKIELYAQKLNNNDLERITNNAVNTTDFIQYGGEKNYPIIRYKNKNISKDNFEVFACQLGVDSPWRTIDNSVEFGHILRHLSLLGQGLIKIFKDNKPENETIIQIKYSKPILWN